MATRVWGAGSGAGTDKDFGNADNWTDDTAPVDNDTIVFSDVCTVDCTGTMDQSAVNFAAIIVEAGYTGTIGATGTPLLIEASDATPLLFMKGTGSVFISGKITSVITLAGTTEINGTITRVQAFGGNVTAKDGATVTTWKQDRSSQASANPVGEIEAGTTVTTVDMSSGTLAASVGITNVNVYGGEYTQAIGNVGTLTIAGGVFIWDAGDITTAYAFGGKIDGTGDATAKTITTLEDHTGATTDLANGRMNLDVTTRRYFGGKLVLDVGREHAV